MCTLAQLYCHFYVAHKHSHARAWSNRFIYTYADICLLQKVNSGMGIPDWNVSIVDIQLRKCLWLWVYSPGHAGVKRHDQSDRLACKSNPHQWLSSRKVWSGEELETLPVAQSQGHHTIDRWRKEEWKEEALDNLHWKDERGPSPVRRTLELFERQRWGNFWDTGLSEYGLFRVHRYHLKLSCSLTRSYLKCHVYNMQWCGALCWTVSVTDFRSYCTQCTPVSMKTLFKDFNVPITHLFVVFATTT